MIINDSKSTLTAFGCTQHEIVFTTQCFPFTLHKLKYGLKYLGFRLKPFGYKIVDWTWLIAKVEKHLHVWYHKYLSRAGRLVLINTVIEVTPVFWMTLA